MPDWFDHYNRERNMGELLSCQMLNQPKGSARPISWGPEPLDRRRVAFGVRLSVPLSPGSRQAHLEAAAGGLGIRHLAADDGLLAGLQRALLLDLQLQLALLRHASAEFSVMSVKPSVQPSAPPSAVSHAHDPL